MGNEVVGRTRCRCGAEDAEVRRGSKGKLYEVCDECVGQYRAMSAKGQREIKARMDTYMQGQELPAPAPAADPVPEVKPAPKAKPAKSHWASVFGVEGANNAS